MKFSDNNFKQLNEELKIKEPHLKTLKASIQQAARKRQARRKPVVLAAAALLGLMLLTLPLYSPVLANIIAKVKPLEISEASPLTTELMNIFTTSGYNVSAVGYITKDNIIEITLEKGHGYDVASIEEIAKSYLTEQGYDLYTIDIKEVKTPRYKGNAIYDDVRQLVKDVFAQFGYAKEADYELAGIQETWFSNILTLDMPDHIQEVNEIVKAIEAEIDAQNLNIKKVEVHSFNLQHRLLDGAWGTAAAAMYDAMAAQQAYALNGLTTSVKNGHATIQLKTAWETKPSAELAAEIQQQISAFLQSAEVQAYLPASTYTIQFVNEQETLLEISNK